MSWDLGCLLHDPFCARPDGSDVQLLTPRITKLFRSHDRQTHSSCGLCILFKTTVDLLVTVPPLESQKQGESFLLLGSLRQERDEDSLPVNGICGISAVLAN